MSVHNEWRAMNMFALILRVLVGMCPHYMWCGCAMLVVVDLGTSWFIVSSVNRGGMILGCLPIWTWFADCVRVAICSGVVLFSMVWNNGGGLCSEVTRSHVATNVFLWHSLWIALSVTWVIVRSRLLFPNDHCICRGRGYSAYPHW